MLGTQFVLFNLAILIGFALSFDVFNVASLSFDIASMKYGSMVAAIMIVLGLVFDKLPSRFARETYRDTKNYVINLVGRDTDVFTGLLLAVLLSLGAGFAEEVFFRGMLFQSILRATNDSDIAALIISSAVFGLAHYPVFGQKPLLESFLGGTFGFLYISSGYNLAVPIVAHSLYDAATIFFTWLAARKEIRDGVKKIRTQGKFPEWRTELGRELVSAFPETWYLLKDVFEKADVNSDGFISEDEFPLALRMLGYSDKRPFGRDLKGASRTFEKFDANRDGKISFEEFVNCIREYELFSKFESGNTY